MDIQSRKDRTSQEALISKYSEKTFSQADLNNKDVFRLKEVKKIYSELLYPGAKDPSISLLKTAIWFVELDPDYTLKLDDLTSSGCKAVTIHYVPLSITYYIRYATYCGKTIKIVISNTQLFEVNSLDELKLYLSLQSQINHDINKINRLEARLRQLEQRLAPLFAQ
jgi:hypothetical protein